MKLHAKLEKLHVLEKECLRLTATRQTAEDKIKCLEEKLKEEEHQRRLFQDRACEVRKLQEKIENSRINESSGIHGNPKGSKNLKTSPRKCVSETSSFQRDRGFQPVQVHSLQSKLRRDDIKWEQ